MKFLCFVCFDVVVKCLWFNVVVMCSRLDVDVDFDFLFT